MTAPAIVQDLVERFTRNRESYRAAQYNETQLRREFLDPLFKALGWDVDNEKGRAEAYKDVIHEDAIKIGGESKAPDYCFRIGGRRIFFLEAKKPAVNLREDVSASYQLRRYAWSAKLPLSILSDFEELAVYDCRVKPDKKDKPSVARVMFVTCEQFVGRWDDLAGIFSRDAVERGSFDKFAEGTRLKRGTAEVDAAFLSDIEGWREVLARNFALRNPELSQRDLNFAVQRTIDRIIFLRLCEDRGIEPYGQLSAIQNGEGTYARLRELFDRADERYNSGLFHFHAERDRAEAPDELTPRLALDDKSLKQIVRGLYYPESPYEFSVLPAEILGHVYEQFLGKVIKLTGAHRAVVEDKPEVKKAGGVYYTPAYIVDYIVRNTVGKLVDGKTPKQVAKLRVLDPACGSGSFLVGALEFLLDWHRDWYLENGPEQHARQLYRGAGGQWYLAASEKKRILLKNIYGVDIDSQAVEVTKLSLLLKVLEHENRESLERQLRLLHERALPDLGHNIKCGNSLIGPDFYNGRQLRLLDEEEHYRINAFDWRTEFAEVFKPQGGGFDAVIGNPPYVRIQALSEWNPIEAEYYKRAFRCAAKGNYDIYVVFVERGLELLRAGGRLGYIVPSKFLTTDYGEPLRGQIAGRKALALLVDFGHETVFDGVSTYTVLLFLTHDPCAAVSYIGTSPRNLGATEPQRQTVQEFDASRITGAPWIFRASGTAELVAKLLAGSTELVSLPARMSRGSSTGADDIFTLTVAGRRFRDREGNPVELEPGILRIPLYATDFNRYRFRPADTERVIFPYIVGDNGYELMPETRLRNDYPGAFQYLRSKRQALDRRKQVHEWFGFSAPRNLHLHDHADFVVPLLANRGMCAPLPSGANRYCLMASGGFSVSVEPTCPAPSAYVLALVNSKLLFWYLRQISNRFRGGWITCTKQYFGRLPIRMPHASDANGARRRDELAALVSEVVKLNAKLAEATGPDAQMRLGRRIEAAERAIDNLVYKVYGLSDAEISMVESGAPDA